VTKPVRDVAQERQDYVVSGIGGQYRGKGERGHRPNEHDEPVLSAKAGGGINEEIDL
jgi:hypothetical protein